jgi:Protein of unknown function (DUF3830)
MPSKPQLIRLVLGEEPVAARFRLLWEDAPKTCAAVVGALPFEGEALHGTCSGTMAVFFFDRELEVGPENATTCAQVGDLFFTHYPANWRQGHPAAVSEVYWAYAPYARPTVPGLFVAALASVFARHTDSRAELDAFCRRSERLHREGAARIVAEISAEES